MVSTKTPAGCVFSSVFGCSIRHVWGAGSAGDANGSSIKEVFAAINVGADSSVSKSIFAPRLEFDSVIFEKDDHFSGGMTVNLDALYNLSESPSIEATRKTARAGLFSYEIPVPAGTYRVEFQIDRAVTTEQLTDLGNSFNITAESSEAVTYTYETAYFSNVMNILLYDVTVSDGYLSLEFDLSISDYGLISIYIGK